MNNIRKKDVRVQIVQPVVPEYKAPFFELLAKKNGYEIEVWASIESFDGIKSAECEFVRAEGWHKLVGVAYWQCGVKLSPHLESGDVLVICGNPRFLSNIPLVWQARRRNIGVVWWGHGWTAGSNRLRAAMRRRIMQFADTILLYTQAEVERYKQEGFPSEVLFGANNTIDQRPIVGAKANYDSNMVEEFRKNEGVDDKIVVLFCGRLTQKARLEIAIEAIDILNERGGNHLLVVIGDGEELIRLKEMVAMKRLDNSIRWLGKMYDIEAKLPWFMVSTCFVYPGAVGLSLLEAFCYGLPVITHKNLANQMPEIAALEHGVNGLMFEEGNADELANCIRKISENNKLREDMSIAAKRTIAREYSIEHMAGRFLDAVDGASRNATKEYVEE